MEKDNLECILYTIYTLLSSEILHAGIYPWIDEKGTVHLIRFTLPDYFPSCIFNPSRSKSLPFAMEDLAAGAPGAAEVVYGCGRT